MCGFNLEMVASYHCSTGALKMVRHTLLYFKDVSSFKGERHPLGRTP